MTGLLSIERFFGIDVVIDSLIVLVAAIIIIVLFFKARKSQSRS